LLLAAAVVEMITQVVAAVAEFSMDPCRFKINRTTLLLATAEMAQLVQTIMTLKLMVKTAVASA
jgi:hypothetical protein